MINSIILFSIRNKGVIIFMTIALIIGGIYSATKIPLDAVPDISNNQVLVISTAPNLGTEDIEKFVTYQVELAVSNLPDIEEIRSVSRFGLSVVTIVFKDKAGTYKPRQLVSEALIEVKEKIPKGFSEPFMAPISTGLGEIYQYTLEVQPGYDSVYNDMELRTIQDWIVKRQMALLPGVVEVNSFGGRGKQYEISVNPDKLRSMGLTINDIFKALEENNQNIGGAYIEKNHQANFIRGEGLMRSLDDIRNTKVANLNGMPVFIRDVAVVKYGSFVRYGAFTKNGKGEAVGGIVMMLKGENSNEVIARVKERVKLIQKSLPDGIKIEPFLDRSKLIKSTTETVAENLSLGALIVIFVLVLILGNIRGGLIVASTIPLSMLFAFIMMYIFGVWANLMSLGAIDFGILVDGAVIIVESMLFNLNKNDLIGKKLHTGERNDIAFKSSSKMMNSAFFGQIIILIVFLPVFGLQGVEGKMFIPMAMTFAFAMIGAIILCLTYIPMIASIFLQPKKNDKQSIGEKFVSFLEKIYIPVLNWAFRKSKIVIISAIVLVIAGFFIFTKMGAEFIPQLDEGDFAFQAIMKPGTSLSEVVKTSTKIEQIVKKNFPDEVESIQSRIGVANLPMDPMPIDIADIFVILKHEDKWTKAKSKQELIDKIREKVNILPGINYAFTQPIEMRFNELLTGIREDLAIKLYGEDLDVLADKAAEVAKIVKGIDGVAGINVEATRGLPQITIKYNRNKLGLYDLNIKDLNTIVQTAFSGGVAGVIYEGEKMFDLVVRLDKEHRKSIENIRNIYINLKNGAQIPLKEVAEIDYQPGPMQISRDNTHRRVYVGINVENRDIKSLVDEIQNKLDNQLELPPGYYLKFGGAFENLERAADSLSLLVPLALALIFILIFFAIKSLKHTLMIYIAVPFAAVGGIISLYIRGMPLSISAGVGFIVLFGVAVLNGLILINGLNALKKEGGMRLTDFIKKGAVRRVRPILMTASVDILGFLPMAVSVSAGAEVQRPLATVVIGGMMTSTLLTLVVLPVLYKLVETPRKKNQKNNIKIATFALLLFTGLFGFSNNINAQELQLTLPQTIELAKQNYPSLKAAEFEVDKQKALKATAYDFGTTAIYTSQEEMNRSATGIQTHIAIEQNDINVFGIFAKRNLAKAKTDWANTAKYLTEYSLIRDVSKAWFNVANSKLELELLKDVHKLYTDFLKAAELRYRTKATSKLEYLSASAKHREIQVNLTQAESQYKASLDILNRFLNLNVPFDVTTDVAPENMNFKFLTADSLIRSPILDLFAKNIKIAENSLSVQRTKYLPKFDLSYAVQSVDGLAGFKAWKVGINLPLVFASTAGQVEASKLDYYIAKEKYKQTLYDINALYKAKLKQFYALKEVLNFYSNKALPLANEQIQGAKLSYKLGDIGYIQFIQNVEAAIRTKSKYIEQQKVFFDIAVELQFLTSNNK